MLDVETQFTPSNWSVVVMLTWLWANTAVTSMTRNFREKQVKPAALVHKPGEMTHIACSLISDIAFSLMVT